MYGHDYGFLFQVKLTKYFGLLLFPCEICKCQQMDQYDSLNSKIFVCTIFFTLKIFDGKKNVQTFRSETKKCHKHPK